MLKVYDSLSKQKKEFKPVTPGQISIYVCGNTVYDHCHIGHARSMLVFDMITRYLRSQEYKVTYVRNITDIDDKIIRRANENSESCDELTARYIKAQGENEKSLGIASPDHEPKATEYVQQIIKLIETIIDNGHAYVAGNGDVCFDVRSQENYGKLSHRNVDDLRSGMRVEIGESKRDPLDFVLWKMSKPEEPSWDSPWGKGRPGWHIECSAMSSELLGQPFDIHGGGLDLKFPHHENEIAQSEAACKKDFANYWMHVGLLQINKEKMSKSLGNFFTITEVLEKHHFEVVRYFMLSSHYRSPINYSEDNLSQMRHSLERLYTAMRGLAEVEPLHSHKFIDAFNAAMNDDFNTPEALAVLFDMARDINKLRDEEQKEDAAKLASTLKSLAVSFGILQQDPEAFLQGELDDADASKIDAMIVARNKAREEKQWVEADRIRDELRAMNIIIEDGAGEVRWRKE